MVTVVVLLGPPGSGKSAVGQALGAHGLRWREWEPMIVERWGSREAFVANKADALPALHREILEWIAEESSPAAIESTGLSDAPLIELLDDAGQSFVVRLDVTEDEALRRVDDREAGRHLTDDLDANRRVYRAFQDRVVPHTRVDLVIDTEAQSGGSDRDVDLREPQAHVIGARVDLPNCRTPPRTRDAACFGVRRRQFHVDDRETRFG